ncbi:hypothetical protein TKK_0003317 [Trichogramma kaykai]
MEEFRGSPAARRLDPRARLASELLQAAGLGSSSSAPCSPQLARHGDSSSGPASLGCQSPRMARRGRQGPPPPPRPRHKQILAQHYNEPPAYANVPNNSSSSSSHSFKRDNSFSLQSFQDAMAAKAAGYAELRGDSRSSSPMSSVSSPKLKISPFNFTSDSSGHVEYVDSGGRSFSPTYEPLRVRSPNSTTTTTSAAANTTTAATATSGSSRNSFERRQPASSSSSSSEDKQQQPQAKDAVQLRLFSTASSLLQQQQQQASSSSSKSFDRGYESAVADLNWQERYLKLQLELHRTQNEAIKVQDTLREKVSELHVRLPEL